MKINETATNYTSTPKRYTYKEYLELQQGEKRYEVIDGELIMVAAPNTIHQFVILNLINKLQQYLKESKVGILLISPVDVVLSEIDVVQPDIMVILNENKSIITEKNITGAPDFIIEVLSKSTAYYDLLEKKELYAKCGVKEYWLVDPKMKWIETYQNDNKKFNIFQHVDEQAFVTSNVLPGLKINFYDILQIG